MSSTSSKSRKADPTPHLEWGGERWIALGELVGTHGVRGELRLRPFNADSNALAAAESVVLTDDSPAPVEVKVERARPHGRVWLVRLEGVGTPEAARALVGRGVAVRERDLEPLRASEYYQYQLIGLSVVDPSGRAIGSVKEIIATGGTDVLAIETPGGERLVPLVDEVVRSVDLEGGRIVVEPLAEGG